jgi:glutathione synthase/RimK-type ligase-like ATP-grasp enzyme
LRHRTSAIPGRESTPLSGAAATSTPPNPRRIAFATSAELATIQPDDAYLADCLQGLGVTPVSCVWTDPGVDWTAFDAVLIRTIWDYFKRYPEFLAWLGRLDRLGVRTINDSNLLRWNSDKRYLLDLAGGEVATIPTHVAAADQIGSVLACLHGQHVVIMPTVSGGAWHTLRGVAGDAALDQAIATLPADLTYLVQPFVAEVASHGEWSLVFIAGRYSHAVLKQPARGDYRVQEEHGGSALPTEPPPAIRAAAEHALAALAGLGHAGHSYARVDGVPSQGEFLIMELELLEPSLYLAGCPAAAERLARHLADALR